MMKKLLILVGLLLTQSSQNVLGQACTFPLNSIAHFFDQAGCVGACGVAGDSCGAVTSTISNVSYSVEDADEGNEVGGSWDEYFGTYSYCECQRNGEDADGNPMLSCNSVSADDIDTLRFWLDTSCNTEDGGDEDEGDGDGGDGDGGEGDGGEGDG